MEIHSIQQTHLSHLSALAQNQESPTTLPTLSQQLAGLITAAGEAEDSHDYSLLTHIVDVIGLVQNAINQGQGAETKLPLSAESKLAQCLSYIQGQINDYRNDPSYEALCQGVLNQILQMTPGG